MSGKDVRYCIYRRARSPYWWVRRTIPGLGELRLSTRVTNKALAQKLDYMLVEFREQGRMDALQALKQGLVTLRELDSNRDPMRLAALLERVRTPFLAPLLDEWLEVGGADSGIRESSMRRYRASWHHLRRLLSNDARLDAIDQAFVTEFKRLRLTESKRDGKKISPATLNRDLAAIGAFLSWCAEEKDLSVDRPKLRYQTESRGRTRWLSTDELRSFREHCPEEWWPLFGLLFGTGMTISEALGLRVCDLDLKLGRVAIHEEHGRKLKRASRARDLSIPESLVPVLAAHIVRHDIGTMDQVFQFTYWPARKQWRLVCKAASIISASLHDARHTFAVHAVQNGIPEARLQRLLGHSHPGTTRRYAMHAPEQFVKRDAETVAKSLGLDAPPLRLEKVAR